MCQTPELILGNCLDVLKKIKENSIDSVVTDPPYEMGFFYQKWDKTGIAYNVEMWKEVYRVMKPGAHLLCFGGCRTYHRMACAVEDAGFELKSMFSWQFATGMPKGVDIVKAINKLNKKGEAIEEDVIKRWEGWKTGIKPAFEPILFAQKPIIEKTFVENALKWGTGALNIDGCRIGNAKVGWGGNACKWNGLTNNLDPTPEIGRYPSNLLFSHAEECKFVGTRKIKGTSTGNGDAETGEESKGVVPLRRGKFVDRTDENGLEEVEVWECVDGCPVKELDKQSDKKPQYDYIGKASRFFYVSKASKKERGVNNNHCTVKPLELMCYLVRLVTPPNGIVLDPFAGSGTTLLACKEEGFRRIGIELNEEYCKIIEKRAGIPIFKADSIKELVF